MRTVAASLASPLLVLLAMAGPAARGEETAEEPPTPATTADRVLQAARGGDTEALRLLALNDETDPWLVADLLCHRGEIDAAEAFADVARRPDTKMLAAYVSACRNASIEPAAREAWLAAEAAREAGSYEKALAFLSDIDVRGPDVVSVCLDHETGRVLASLRRFAESAAAYTASADRAHGLGWLRREARSLQGAAFATRKFDMRAAVALHRRRVAVEEKRGVRADLAAALNNVGTALFTLGDREGALEVLLRACAEADGHAQWTVNTNLNTGGVLGALGRHRRALSHMTRALALQTELGKRRGAARTLGQIGRLHEALDECDRAIEVYERAVEIATSLNDTAAASGWHNDLAVLHMAREAWDVALKHLAPALEHYDQAGDARGTAMVLYNVGLVQSRRGRIEEALRAYARSVELRRTFGDHAGVGRILSAMGHLHSGRWGYEEALAAHVAALAALEKAGDPRWVAGALINIGSMHSELGHLEKAMDHSSRGLELATSIGHEVFAANALETIGEVHRRRKELEAAARTLERVLQMRERQGDKAGIARTLTLLGLAYADGAQHEDALEAYARSLAIQEQIGDRAGVAATLVNIGQVHAKRGELKRGIEFNRRGLELARKIGHVAWQLRALGNLGAAYTLLGRYAESIDFHKRELALAEEAGSAAGTARALHNLGVAQHALGLRTEARVSFERALDISTGRGDRRAMALTIYRLGMTHASFGELQEAEARFREALRLARSLEDRAHESTVLCSLGLLHARAGSHGRALTALERALEIAEHIEDARAIASAVNCLGGVYQWLEDYERALALYRRSLGIARDLEDRASVAANLINIGTVLADKGEIREGIEHYEAGLEAAQVAGQREWEANALANLGERHGQLGEYAKALDYLRRSVALKRDIQEPDGVARDLLAIARIQQAHAPDEDPIEAYERALEASELSGTRPLVALVLHDLARIDVERGLFDRAMQRCRRATELFSVAVGGLSEVEASRARDTGVPIHETGLQAAVARGDEDAVLYFIECGRSGVLREALEARETLWAFTVPEALRALDVKARSDERRALRAYQAARREAVLAKIRAARTDLEAARGRVLETVARIRRTAKSQASLLYPEPDDRASIRSRVREGEALVLYAFYGTRALALVIEPSGARIVPLASVAEIEEAIDAFVRTDAPFVDPERADRLRAQVVEPLELDAEVRRVLVSPAGRLGYVPFVMLLGEREVVYVPSGTTYGLLARDRGLRGTGVLALGDPDYETHRRPRAVALYRAGAAGRLAPLPATVGEVEAVGDVKLLGKSATESGLASALGKRPRWRAIHLACHGLIDHDRPMLSALAITPDEEDDGFLTCLEIFRKVIPADLAVLSACETGKGRIYRAEGIVGLARAFMSAGTPRVLCSLWDVEDRATQALMVKFYELWNPRRDQATPSERSESNGSIEDAGLPAAEALRKAQEHVRSQERWRHPRYWAAWVLWGLPE